MCLGYITANYLGCMGFVIVSILLTGPLWWNIKYFYWRADWAILYCVCRRISNWIYICISTRMFLSACITLHLYLYRFFIGDCLNNVHPFNDDCNCQNVWWWWRPMRAGHQNQNQNLNDWKSSLFSKTRRSQKAVSIFYPFSFVSFLGGPQLVEIRLCRNIKAFLSIL